MQNKSSYQENSKQNYLIINAGSSSIKFAIFSVRSNGTFRRLSKGLVSAIGSKATFQFEQHKQECPWIQNHEQGITLILEKIETLNYSIRGIGHRVVHGGEHFIEPIQLNSDVLAKLESMRHLAPNHLPHNINAIKALFEKKPNIAQVACFDTAFHATQPELETTLPLPKKLLKNGLRRYGFHGLSYDYIASNFKTITGRKLPSKTIIAHLGNGASLCAINNGKSIATTMGFSTLEGLTMGNRSGSIDPGVLLYLMYNNQLSVQELSNVLYNESGLKALSGISNEMQEILKVRNETTAFAIDYYCNSIVKHIGMLATSLEGLDGLVFTGGIGENASIIREKVCSRLAWLGVSMHHAQEGYCISNKDSKISIWVIPTNEELMIARYTHELAS